ncbi:C-C motif chemokine 8-like [Rhinophrynus dorsalis]
MIRILLLGLTFFCSDVLSSEKLTFDYRRPIKVSITCCTSVSRARIKYPIINYKMQSVANRCVQAVIFRTKDHGSFCSDPKAKWVKKKIWELDNLGTTAPIKPPGKKKQRKKKQKEIQKKRKTKQARTTVSPLWFPTSQTTVL